MSKRIEFATLVTVYAFSVVGKFVIEFTTGFNFEQDCWPWPGKRFSGLLGRWQKCKKLSIPPLLGMIILGCVARNLLPYNSFMS
jgi:hypothetical protein